MIPATRWRFPHHACTVESDGVLGQEAQIVQSQFNLDDSCRDPFPLDPEYRLTDDWREMLGPDAEEKHWAWRYRLANLVLVGSANDAPGEHRSFDAKKERYRRSPVSLTSRVAEKSAWGRGYAAAQIPGVGGAGRPCYGLGSKDQRKPNGSPRRAA